MNSKTNNNNRKDDKKMINPKFRNWYCYEMSVMCVGPVAKCLLNLFKHWAMHASKYVYVLSIIIIINQVIIINKYV